MATIPIPMDAYLIDQCRCPECGQTCLQKNIYRHMITLHRWSREDCKTLIMAIRTEKKGREKQSFVCSYCRAIFRSVRHLVQHRRICSAQPEIPEEDDELDGFLDDVEQEEVVEYLDDKPSTSNYEVLPPHRTPRGIQPHHLAPEDQGQGPKVIHDSEDANKTKFLSGGGGNSRHRAHQMKCPECTSTVDSVEDLISHCAEKHEANDRKFVVEREVFNTFRDFKRWFDQRQEDTCTSLTKRTGHGGETLYRCHRIGKYQSVAKARKSNPRKIDQTCTAYLKVFTRDDDGSTWATGCFTHIGHELDHRLLWLTETQEHYVRELIDLNWTSEQIYVYIRDEYKMYPCKLSYLTKNDVRNITVRYNREKKSELEHKNEKNELRNSKSPDNPKASDEVQEEPSTPPPPLEAPPLTENGRNPEEEYINVVDDEPLPKLDRISED